MGLSKFRFTRQIRIYRLLNQIICTLNADYTLGENKSLTSLLKHDQRVNAI